MNGTASHTSDIFSVGLSPAKPGPFKAALTHGAVSLAWAGASSTFNLQQASDAGFKTGVRSYTSPADVTS